MRKTINKLTLIYYGFYVLAIMLAAWGYSRLAGQPPLVDEHSTTGVTLTSAYILLLIVSIPLSLKLFNVKVKKLAEAEGESDGKATTYFKLASLRLVVIGANLLIGVLLFYLLNSRSMIFCAAIAAVALVFCKPGEAKANNELQTNR